MAKKIPKMNPEVKAKWVAALESGEYQQIQGSLNVEDKGFCCLGVLCDIYVKEHPETATWTPRPSSALDFKSESNRRFEVSTLEGKEADAYNLVTVVNVWSGLDEDAEVRLAAINDRSKSFKSTTAYIKRYL